MSKQTKTPPSQLKGASKVVRAELKRRGKSDAEIDAAVARRLGAKATD
jgi:hypothetical protein